MGIHQICHRRCCGNPPNLASELLWESTFWQFQHPTYCGNPPNLSSELLWESINSFIGATVGIHMNKQVCCVRNLKYFQMRNYFCTKGSLPIKKTVKKGTLSTRGGGSTPVPFFCPNLQKFIGSSNHPEINSNILEIQFFVTFFCHF